MRRSLTAVAALAALALVPGLAHAQPASQFTGVVTDNTGGILPGVTVEASSPALIEGSRVAITDGAGRYLLVDLRPGIYNITFTLPGFSTVLVEEQELPAGFTANVDAVLSVGALEETVTVSGEAPVVDVQSISQAEVLDREVLDAIPTGRNLQSTAQLIPGVKMNRPEVGLTTAAQQTYMSVHGMSNRQTTVMVDGQLVMSSGGDGAVQNYNNQLAAQEMVYETSGISAETQTGGVRISMIPREGGNTHSGQNYFGFTESTLQADNHHQRLIDRGLTSTESVDYVYDLNVAHGGPLIRDKLWFFGSGRRFSINVPVTDSFYKNEDGTAPPLHAGRQVSERHGGPEAGYQRRSDHERAAAPDLADEPEQQVLGLPGPDHQAAVPRLRRTRRRRHRVAPPRLADLLRGGGQVDVDHQQPAPAGSRLLDQRRELEQRRPGGRRAERAGPRVARRQRRPDLIRAQTSGCHRSLNRSERSNHEIHDQSNRRGTCARVRRRRRRFTPIHTGRVRSSRCRSAAY